MSFQHDDVYKQGIHDLAEINPGLVDAYNTFTGTCFEDGSLSKKQKELIALGISLSHRDDNCVRYHVTEAVHKGATEQEIWEAVQVAVALSGGLTVSQSVHWVKDAILVAQNLQ